MLLSSKYNLALVVIIWASIAVTSFNW